MSTNHELYKKIAKLTKVIYNLNIENGRFQEDLLEERSRSHRIRNENEEFFATSITKCRDEICKLKKDIDAKQTHIESLTAKINVLIDEKREETTRNRRQVETHQDEVKQICHDFGKRMQDMKDRHEGSIRALSQSSTSLKEELSVMRQKIRDQTAQINNLNDSHDEQIASIIKKHERELYSIRCKNDREIEELKFTTEDDRRRSMDHLQSKHKSEIDERERQYKLREKQMTKLHLDEIEVLKTTKTAMQAEIEQNNQQELKKVHEIIKQKDVTIKAAELSLTREIDLGKLRTQEVNNELTRARIELKSKQDSLLSSEMTVSKFREKMQQVASERDQLLRLLEKASEEKERLQTKISEVLQSKNICLSQRDQAETEKKELSITMKKLENNIESKLCGLKSKCTSIHLTLKDTKAIQNYLKEYMNMFICDIIEILKQIQGAYEEQKSSTANKYLNMKHAMAEERNILQSSHDTEIYILNNEIENHKKAVSAKEEQSARYEAAISELKHQLEKSKDNINETRGLLSQKEKEYSFQKERLGCIIHEMETKLSMKETEISTQKELEMHLKSKLRDISGQYEKCCDENKELNDSMECMRNSFENKIGEKEEVLETIRYRHNVAMLNLKKKFEASQKALKDEFDLNQEQTKSELKNKIHEIEDLYELRFNEYRKHQVERIEDKWKIEMEKKKNERKQFDTEYKNLTSKFVELSNEQSQMKSNLVDAKNRLSQLMEDVKVLKEDRKKIKMEKTDIDSLMKEHVHLQEQNQEVLHKLKRELQRKGEMYNELKEQLIVKRNIWEADINKQKCAFLSERKVKIEVQGQLNILRQELIGQSEMIIRLSKQVNDTKEELNVIEEDKKHLLADITMKESLRRKTLTKKLKRTILCIDSKLRLTSKDLEYSVLRLANRKSLPEDTEKMRHMELELSQYLQREKKMKDEMAFYKNELRNREENYNSRFVNSYAQQNVGVVNVLNRKRSSVGFGKENGKPVNKSNRRKSLQIYKPQTHGNFPRL